MSEPESDSVAHQYEQRLDLLRALSNKLAQVANEALSGVPHIDRLAFRAKDRDSFTEKALSYKDEDQTLKKYERPFTEIEDQVAGRAIVFFLDDIKPVREQLVAAFGAVERVVKEPAQATSFGYESEHFVFVIAEHHKPADWDQIPEMPRTFEMQLRTLFMHAWAEPQHDLGYKGDQALSRDAERQLAWVAASAWGADRTLNEVAHHRTTPT